MKQVFCDSSIREACIWQDGFHNIATYPQLVTNNVGEYRAVLWAIRTALPEKESVTVLTDSKLVVEQGNGRWKCKKAHLIPYCDQVKEYLAHYQHIKLEWISREDNPAGKILERR
jgi:ribonuclease HI